MTPRDQQSALPRGHSRDFATDSSLGVADLLSYRAYVAQQSWLTLRHRYAGSEIGIFWNVIHPLLQVALYGTVFSLVFAPPSGRAAFRFQLCAGLLPLLAFSEGLVRGTSSLVQEAGRLRSVRVPLPVFVAISVTASTLVLYLVLFVLAACSIWLARPVGWDLLLLPVVGGLLQLFGFGLSLVLSSLRAFFVDVSEVLRLLLQLVIWTMPIVYPETLLPAGLHRWMALHPVYPFVASIRSVLTGPAAISVEQWTAMVVWTFAALATGWVVARRLEGDVRDVL